MMGRKLLYTPSVVDLTSTQVLASVSRAWFLFPAMAVLGDRSLENEGSLDTGQPMGAQPGSSGVHLCDSLSASHPQLCKLSPPAP